MTRELHVACGTDENHAAHSAAMIDSVMAHRGDHDLHVHYLVGPAFSHRSRKLITGMVQRGDAQISIHEIADVRVSGFPVLGHAPSALWYRIFLPELLPECDRILYLDTDVIVVDSLAPLWATDLGENYVAAVTNVWQHNHLEHAPDRGISRQDYFNSGVLLFNLDAWRREDVTAELQRFVVDNAARLGFADQDAMNMLFSHRRLRLHPRWNVMNSILLFDSANEVFTAEEIEEARRNPAIRHFEGPSLNKPWHYLCEHDMRELYLRHRRRTPWPRVRPEGRTPLSVLRRALR